MQLWVKRWLVENSLAKVLATAMGSDTRLFAWKRTKLVITTTQICSAIIVNCVFASNFSKLQQIPPLTYSRHIVKSMKSEFMFWDLVPYCWHSYFPFLISAMRKQRHLTWNHLSGHFNGAIRKVIRNLQKQLATLLRHSKSLALWARTAPPNPKITQDLSLKPHLMGKRLPIPCLVLNWWT